MDYYNFNAQQGWQCPICKRVYSPYTSMCYYCGNRTVTVDYKNKDMSITEIIKEDGEKLKKVNYNT